MKVFLTTLGCKLNFAEVDQFSEQFVNAGYGLSDTAAGADVQIVHTCTVTGMADKKSRQIIRKAKRDNPQALLMVSGCYAETSPGVLNGLPEVDLVVGQRQKANIVQLAESIGAAPNPYEDGVMPHPLPLVPLRTRAFIKIMDGCNDFCAYCIIPHSRGRVASVAADDIVAEVQNKLSKGHKEIVLTGVSIGAYGEDRGPKRSTTNLVQLIHRILDETDVQRLRITSLEPHDFDPALCELFRDPRICPHLHLCLQSGSNGVLKRMRRRYDTAEFASIVDGLRAVNPGISITTDVIVGFPCETDAEFDEACAFIEKVRFADLHVFRYSAREGTRAAAFEGQIDDDTKKARSERLIALGSTLAGRYLANQVGEKRNVLFETREEKNGITYWQGLSENYVRMYVRSDANLHSTVRPVVVERCDWDSVEARLIGEAV